GIRSRSEERVDSAMATGLRLLPRAGRGAGTPLSPQQALRRTPSCDRGVGEIDSPSDLHLQVCRREGPVRVCERSMVRWSDHSGTMACQPRTQSHFAAYLALFNS